MAPMTRWMDERLRASTWRLPMSVWTVTKKFGKSSTTTSLGPQRPRWRVTTAQPTMSLTVCTFRIGPGTASSAISKDVCHRLDELGAVERCRQLEVAGAVTNLRVASTDHASIATAGTCDPAHL